DSSRIVARVRKALDQGLLTTADIDTAVRRQLSVRFRLGEFDPGPDPWADPGDFDTPAHRDLAREAAEQAVVLLRNDGLLPLAREDTRVAVVGLLADECKLDWYSGTLIHRSTPLEGLYERFGADRVDFAEGVDRVRLRTPAGTYLSVRPADDGAADTAGDPAGERGAPDPAL
ncbi:glycoside hydrolase family 3 C-terminal domain-containing protein, partial [Streptomyces sp. 8P21H-1]|uniref:glycoside hydrolase family 3 C-terminal domain-containing protein n=1 Tax=Streptomyces sp. 8P21H-1 TaxID=2737048 RepID=UPI00156F5AD1